MLSGARRAGRVISVLSLEQWHRDQVGLDMEDCPEQARKGKRSKPVGTTIGPSKWCHWGMLCVGENPSTFPLGPTF